MKSMAIALVLSLVLPRLALAQCPENHVGAGANGHGLQYDTSDPEKSYEGTPVVPGGPCVSCYSWPAGYFRVSGASAPSDWNAFVNATDRFQLSGPASDTPLSFRVRLRFSGFNSGLYTNLAVTLYDRNISDSGVAAGFGQGTTFTDRVIETTLHHLPNDPFDLNVYLHVGSNDPYTSGDIQAWLEFMDVPSGYSITSCQGYDVPVPTAPVTWGKVRARYR